ncbi:hypothetical protein ANCCAN_25028 [Ancylostoma caninum]|uniref:Uncharacterized protein n=1 Tax=Ancylostoma caninum TaxID=29170 RepID=A0A368FEA5_ANCCA|nr:hypothetical protein ANCCAN_25028 [Ancylostoma caninum]
MTLFFIQLYPRISIPGHSPPGFRFRWIRLPDCCRCLQRGWRHNCCVPKEASS